MTAGQEPGQGTEPGPDDPDALTEGDITRLEASSERWTALGGQLAAATAAARLRGRLLIAVLAAFLVAVAAFGWAIKSIHDNQVNSCRTANVQRVSERSMWDYVADLVSPSKGQTTPQAVRAQQVADALRSKAATALAERDCAAAYSLWP